MLEKCITLLLLLNLQGCYQSAMVARAMSLFRHKEDRGLCCPNAPPPAWGPSEDYRSITTTFQYLETSGISIKLLCERTDEIEMAVFHTDMRICLPVCRLVLGSHLCERSSGSSDEKMRGDVPDEGQQSSQTHADPVSEDLLRTHQRAHWIQQGLLLAGLHCRRAAVHADLPGRPQPGAVLHELRPRAAEPDTQRRGPSGEAWPGSRCSSGQQCAPEADVPPAQTRSLPFFKAPDAPHHQQARQLPRPAPTPEASAGLPAGLPLSHMRISAGVFLGHSMNAVARELHVFIHLSCLTSCLSCNY